MRQTDYKYVQGVNQMVQMNAPQQNLQGAAAQSGNAMVRLGQQLAQTGQDVSKIMENTVRADEETKLLRMQQKWKEAHNKQVMFQNDNPNDPLAWQDHRAKMMPSLEAYNNEQKFYTKEGRQAKERSWLQWNSNTAMDVDRMSQKKIFMNRAEASVIGMQQAYDEEDPNGIRQAIKQSDQWLDPSIQASWGKKADQLEKQMIFNDSVDMVDTDPKGSKEDIMNGTGHFAHYAKDRDSREKLLAVARSKQSLAAREQGDALNAKVYASPKFTVEDWDKMVDDGELDQMTDGNLAKMRTSFEREDPITNQEIVDAYNMIGNLEKRRSSMSEEEYIREYNNVHASVMSVNGMDSVNWLKTYLDGANPLSKGETGNAIDKSKTRGKKEGTKILTAAYNMGMFREDYVVGEEFEARTDMGEQYLSVQDKASRSMRDVENELHDWIDSQEGEVTTEMVRDKMGRLMGDDRVKKAGTRVKSQYEKANQIKNKNIYRTSGRTSRSSYQNKVNVPKSEGAANVRYNNPSAAYPRKADEKYGVEGYGIIGGGHKIAKFPTPVHGAAANFDLFAENYTGMTFKAAMKKWRGRTSPVPKGYSSNEVIDEDFLNDPAQAIDFFKKMALHESPDFKGMSDADWRSAWDMWRQNA